MSLAIGYLVELLLHCCCEVIVHDFGEIFEQEVIYHNTNVCRHKFRLFGTECLLALFCGNLSVSQCYDVVLACAAGLVALLDISALLYCADSRCVCRRTAYAQFLEFAHQACLGISWLVLCKTLCSDNFLGGKYITFVYCRNCRLLTLCFVVRAFAVNLHESIEHSHFTCCNEALAVSADSYVHCCLLNQGIGHL